MKVLIIYDSVYSNTEQIAQAISNALSPQMDHVIIRVNDVTIEQLTGLDLLIVGSPTMGGRPTQAFQDFFENVSDSALNGIKVAAFDTRLSTKMVGIFGYAAGSLAGSLEKKGGALIALPEGFFVKGRKGPLKEGEIARAASWAKEIAMNGKSAK